MTYEEAIKHFESLQKRYTTEHNGKMCEKVALALEAIEKQIPKKPNNIFCPTCGNISIIDGDYGDRYNYCYVCGQAIDWSDNDERKDEVSE